MRRLCLRRLARLATGACMLLVVQGFGAPTSAWAGCGHPAGSQSDPFREFRRIDALFDTASLSRTHAQLPGLPLERPPGGLPCSGMSCSSRDSLPISTSSPKIESPRQWVAALFAAIDLASNSSSAWPVDEPEDVPVGEKMSVFHPPRA